MISRIAPTPSGYLHLGNAANFVRVWLRTRSRGGTLRLRIDDLDVQRSRREYVEDVFGTLEWMGLDWDLGPKNAEDQERSHSQKLRRSRYLEVLRHLLQQGSAYVCTCSRQDLELRACPCEGRCLGFDPESSMVRLRGGEGKIELGNFTLWRREGFPAYQLVSLVDDIDHRVDWILRGEDLRPSTEAQRFLAGILGKAFGAEAFLQATIEHHPLLSGPGGGKLSKSNHAEALRERYPRNEGPARMFRDLAEHLGLPEPAESLPEMKRIWLSCGF